MPTPADLLAGALRGAPAAPLITWYDDTNDERVELSATTFANWVAKAANLLQEEFDVGPGSTVALALPVHWQTAAAYLAAWSCGAAVLDTAAEDDGRLAEADVVLAAQDRLAALEDTGLVGDDGAQLLGLSLHPLGMGMRDYVGAARDFALEVRTAGDVFVPYEQPDPEAPGLLAGGLELTLGGLVATADELARRLGIGAGDRLLTVDRTAAEAGPVAWLLAPLAAQASLVLVGHPRPDRLAHRAESERVTATLGISVAGVRELGRPA
ncbi:MAG: hypothetical protein JWO98_3650 [Frankiales bacterium]|nr:hypothetical protein [Frankiales bacterium]